jgi:two-component system, OmpR family, sensor histidine kinase SaeS
LSNQTAQVERWIQVLFLFLLGLMVVNIFALLLLLFIASYYPRYILVVVGLILLEFATLFLYRWAAKAQRQKLQEENRRLAESNRFREQLLFILDHELRTPLSGAKGYLELLQLFGNQMSEETKAGYLAQIAKAYDEVSLLVNSISDSLLLQGNQHIVTQSVPLAEIVQEVITLLAPRIREEQREIVTAGPESISVLVDPLRLRQVLRNLLANAMNYSPTGTPIEIRVTLQPPPSAPVAPQAAQVYIGIHDQGIGIPREQQARLFEPFVRLEAARKMAVRGTGLGLFLSKQLLTSMHGSIWIESTGVAGEGTTMWISVPSANEAK